MAIPNFEFALIPQKLALENSFLSCGRRRGLKPNHLRLFLYLMSASQAASMPFNRLEYEISVSSIFCKMGLKGRYSTSQILFMIAPLNSLLINDEPALEISFHPSSAGHSRFTVSLSPALSAVVVGHRGEDGKALPRGPEHAFTKIPLKCVNALRDLSLLLLVRAAARGHWKPSLETLDSLLFAAPAAPLGSRGQRRRNAAIRAAVAGLENSGSDIYMAQTSENQFEKIERPNSKKAETPRLKLVRSFKNAA
ncbi:hypothetical protein [Gimibacter soli]|uniref:Uncharacterized protein n=1 Tax=Gimibacter soli TaxID=3024400 RepID=A0AAE9XQI2_9PROT|nr:hypothetical protein [Gimibacter soli]WCL54424.1 hypothetical protein PH603_01455 [Gimibacter soli]